MTVAVDSADDSFVCFSAGCWPRFSVALFHSQNFILQNIEKPWTYHMRVFLKGIYFNGRYSGI